MTHEVGVAMDQHSVVDVPPAIPLQLIRVPMAAPLQDRTLVQKSSRSWKVMRHV